MEAIRQSWFHGKIETAFVNSIVMSRWRDDERDFVRLGEDFYIGFLYGDVPDVTEFLRSFTSVWLEIKSDNVEEMTRKILDFGVRKLEVPDPHLYFQAPGGQWLRLVGINEDLSFMRGPEKART